MTIGKKKIGIPALTDIPIISVRSRVAYYLFGNDAAGTEIAGLVVAFVFGDLHASDTCVNEFEFAGSIVSGYHNSDVADRSTAAAACEEHEVALAEIALGYLNTFRGLHTRRRADLVAELSVNIA